MKNNLLKMLIFIYIPGGVAWAGDGYFIDRAPVLRVEPLQISETMTGETPICSRPPPAVAATIGEDIRRQQRFWRQGGCGPAVRHRIDGYRVTYRYAGRTLTTVLDRQPGGELSLEVAVEGAE